MLSKDQAAELGLMFYIEGEARPEAPDQDIWAADLTLDGHTWKFVGKSEEEVLAQAEKVLVGAGKIDQKADAAGGGEPTRAQQTDEADLAAFRGQRDETAEELLKQAEERDIVSDDIDPGEQKR